MSNIFPNPWWNREAWTTETPGGQFLISAARSPRTTAGRLIGALESAIRAEQAAIWKGADFYFDIAHDALKKLTSSPQIPVAAVATEILLTTHIGFVKGCRTLKPEAASDDRQFLHAGLAEQALLLTSLDSTQKAAIRAWLRAPQIVALKTEDQWDQALDAASRAVDIFSPGFFKDDCIELHFANATRQLQAKDGDETHDAPILAKSLKQLARFRAAVADRPLVYQRMAELYRRHTAALKNSTVPGPQLAVSQRAVDCAPFDLEWQQIDLSLRYGLSDLQDKILKVEEQIVAEGKVLNEKGEKLKWDAVNGFAEAEVYLESEEGRALERDYLKLWSRGLWLKLGLRWEESWEDRSLELLDLIGATLVERPLTDAGFPELFSTKVARSSFAQMLDAAAVARRLISLRGALAMWVDPAPPELPLIARSAQPIVPVSAQGVEGMEPLTDWFFSQKGRTTRWATAAAAVLVLLAGSFTIYNWRITNRRDALFAQVMTASREERDRVVVDLAGQFLAAAPLSGRDERDQTVRQAYAESLVRLIAQSPSQPDPALVQAAERYSKVARASKGEIQ